ncbi:MAG: nucleoside hydrolase [Chloroflexi bacterium]|nr:nucleoside hydrolase [Chloroflexota bacterium]
MVVPVNVVIDTDPGVDDFLAIALALNSPELAIEAFTTTGGNAALRHTNANMLRILEALDGTAIPVYRGAQRPLVGSFGDAEDVHGEGGLPIRLPTPVMRPRPGHAVKFLARRLANGPPLTLIALGPPTNVARLFRDFPGSRRFVDRVVVMGGALDVPGNVTPYAEFNVWSDPEATAVVFESGVPVTLVGSDVCNRVRAHAADTPPPIDPVIGRLVEAQFAARPGRYITLYDPLTVMAAVRPDILVLEPLAIEVDTTSGPERGRTRRSHVGTVIDVATDVNADAAISLFTERVIRGRFRR